MKADLYMVSNRKQACELWRGDGKGIAQRQNDDPSPSISLWYIEIEKWEMDRRMEKPRKRVHLSSVGGDG